MKVEPGAEQREIHYEETAWKARPDFSPDGKRIVYASYLGGQWHQLWVMPSDGGDPFPISYGDFDNTNPRWSPDGMRIAFISNRGGNTSLWIQEVLGGGQRPVLAKEKHYLKAMGHLSLTILDPSKKPASARVSVTGEDGRAYAPDHAWIHGEDNFVRSESEFEAHYFHSPGKSELTVPEGRIQVEVTKGFEYHVAKADVNCSPRGRLVIRLMPLQIPHGAHSKWASADLHVHMNYGGISQHPERSRCTGGGRESLSCRKPGSQQGAANS
jgi:dipeptidyl aminopeptidase/acylaminoacyl peptidase